MSAIKTTTSTDFSQVTFFASAGSKSVKKESSLSFSAFMNEKLESISINVNAGKTDTVAESVLKVNNKAEAKKQGNADKGTNSVKAGESEAAPVNEKDSNARAVKDASDSQEPVKDEKLSAEATDTTEDSEKTIESASELLASMIIEISKLLGITPEQLNSELDKLSVNVKNLFDGENIMKLFLSVSKSGDVSTLLVDNAMLEKFGELKSFMTELEGSTELSGEELTAAIDTHPEEVREAVGRILDELAAKEDDSPQVIVERTDDSENVINAESLKEAVSAEPLQKTSGQELTEAKEPAADEAVPGTKELLQNTEETDNGKAPEQGNDNSKGDGSGNSDKSVFVRRASNEKTSGPEKTKTTATMQSFVSGLEKSIAAENLKGVSTENLSQIRDIVYQLTDAIKVQLSPEKTSLELQLTPESLGKVQVNVSSKEGVMTAKITTENQTAREAVESRLQILKDSFEEKGIKVEAIEVTVSNFNFSDSRFADRDSREKPEEKHGRAVRISGSAEMTDSPLLNDAERIEREMMIQNGTTINYVA